MQSVENKVVVITGASRGIGAATSELFAANGARLVLCGRDAKALAQIKKKTGLADNMVLTVTADIRKAAGMKKIVSATIKKFKRIDIFINNAGVGISKPITETTEQEFDQIFQTNLKAVYYSFVEVLPFMKKQGAGHIINISSGAARIGSPNMAAYAGSKAALNVLSESVANEVRNDNVKVSVLAPASTDTNFMSNMSKRSKSPSRAKRKLTPTEVAEAILSLTCMNENAWTSMADIRPLSINR